MCGCRLYSKFQELQVQYNGHASPGISDSSGLFSVIEDQFYKASAMCQSTQHHTLSKNPQSSATWYVFFQERVGSQNSLPMGQRRKDSVYPQRQEQDSFLRWTMWHGREANVLSCFQTWSADSSWLLKPDGDPTWCSGRENNSDASSRFRCFEPWKSARPGISTKAKPCSGNLEANYEAHAPFQR